MFRSKKKYKSSSSDDDSDDDVRGGIPKFKGLLLSYPEGLPPQPDQQKSSNTAKEPKVGMKEEDAEENDIDIQKKLLKIAFEPVKKKKDEPVEIDTRFLAAVRNSTCDDTDTGPTTSSSAQASSVINFKKSKQQKSDELRMKSFEKMKDLKSHRKNLIKSSLSSVPASAPVTDKRKVFDEDEEQPRQEVSSKPGSKKGKMTLFNDDDSGEEDLAELNDTKDVFKVKKQFSGAQGQKLLELQTRWGDDDRFKIDDRFKENDDDDDIDPNGEIPVEKEKEKQLDILNDLFGKDFKGGPKQPKSSKIDKSASSSSFSAVILPRYDPEAEQQEIPNSEPISENKEAKRKKKEEKAAVPEEPKPIRSTEPATYKTVSNLKEMFSSAKEDDAKHKPSANSLFDSSSKPTFSLLSTFGKTPDDDEDVVSAPKSASTATSSSGPRSFWLSNPFRYDSSDDEDDAKSKSTNNKKVEAKEKPAPAPSEFKVHGKVSFFFTKNDKRFEGLEDYFLKLDDYEGKGELQNGDKEDGHQQKEDFSIKRQELKAIVKAKIRNTKRKDEKRTLAIKRALRKRKRKYHQKNKVHRTS